MKQSMFVNWQALVVVFLFGIANRVVAVSAGAGEEPHAVYDLHEWGVFPIARNDKWAMSDLRAEWATFPAFFYRVWPDKRLTHRGAVKKPVIFLHAEKAGLVQLEVRFAEGRPLVWWPAAVSPAYGAGDNSDQLRFELDLRELENHKNHRVHAPPAVDAGHWIETLRKVHSSTVTASAGLGGKSGDDYTQESFVYYDGVMKAPAVPKVTVENNQVVLETASEFPLLDVMVVDNTTKSTRFAKTWTEKIDAGKQTTRIELNFPAADGNGGRQGLQMMAGVRAEFCKRLCAAGLNADEAESLAKVWESGLFKHDGLSVFYRVPQEVYEKWLPLTAKPAPKKTVRVGIVFHAHLEPGLDERVEQLVAKLAAENFKERQAVQKELEQIGGASFPVLEKHFNDKDAQIAKACRDIVNALSTMPALEDKK